MKKINLKNFFIINLTIMILLLISFTACSKDEQQIDVQQNHNQPQEIKTADLSIIHFNDFHAAFRTIGKSDEQDLPKWGGAGVLGGYIKNFRSANENTLIFFSGDMIQKTPLEEVSKAESLIDIFNILKPDAATLGNHEFDYGREHLETLLKKIKYPVVSANIFDAETGKSLVPEYCIISTKNNVKILVIGLYPVSGKKYAEKDFNVKIKEPLDIVKKIARQKDAEVDLTVILSHLGIGDDIELSNSLSKNSEVDLIIGGHSHTLIEKIDNELPVPVVQAYCNGYYLGQLNITADLTNNKITKLDYKIIPTYQKNIEPDAQIEEIVKTDMEKIPELFKTIAKTEKPLGNESRTGETNIGNFSVDVLSDIFKTDLAFMNSKSIRSSISGPEICANDIIEAFPFEGGLYKVKITGENIIKMIEYYYNKKKDRQLFVPYNLFYRYSENNSGNIEVTEILFKGKELKPSKQYTAVTDERTAEEFERYYDAENMGKIAENLSDEYIKYLKKIKVYKPYKPGRFEKN
ncbi:bifunctional metallophosphatase/5'-nucleotidase [Candidatus Dependentiae bacterium]|nr:bifunctional metallophosphatase/5'-nucleotidase [Candidatus Dependentiae bacterium]